MPPESRDTTNTTNTIGSRLKMTKLELQITKKYFGNFEGHSLGLKIKAE